MAIAGLVSSADRASAAPLVGGGDACTSPDAIVGTGTFAFDLTAATTGVEGQNDAACNVSFASGTAILDDVWFAWTAPASGIALVRTCALTSVDTKLAAWSGSGCPVAGALACNDDDCGPSFQSRMTFPCTLGAPYVIQIGLYPGTFPVATPGVGSFEVSVAPAPSNDACASPVNVIGSAPVAFDGTLASTSAEGQAEAACLLGGTTAIARDLWFTWTAPASGPFAVVTHGLTRVDTKLAVYAGTGCPVAAAIACSDDARADLQSVATFTAAAGATYTIQLGAHPGVGGGPGEFAVIPAVAPANDECASPIAWIGAGSFLFDTTFATTGTTAQAEPACAAFTSTAIANDAWYAWTATASGTATLSTCAGTSVDTKLAVHAGAACPTSAPLVCQDDTPAGCGATSFQSEVAFPVTCGSTYLIQLGTYPLYSPPAVGGLGRVSLTLTGAPCAVSFCFGDGSGAACPCGNVGAAGRGCANATNAAGAALAGSGTPSLALDTFVLAASGVPNGPGLFFQGTVPLANGRGIAFGDGLRCVGGSVVRLGIVTASGATAVYPGPLPPNDVPISVRGGNVSGATRSYQVWYRDAAAFCTSATFNLTGAVAVTWAP